ncbi:MAG: hypothetical protein AAB583_02425 [Patescibacteria group bacterium]
MKELLRDPPNQQEIAGLNPDSSTTENPAIPSVLRDTRGRVLWKLHGNTPEENEQLGIQNVQGLFLESHPDFLEHFPLGEDGKIVEDKREEAKMYILDKIQNIKDFLTVIGSSPLRKNSVPYFKGSHISVNQKSFRPWGINIEERDSLKRHRSIEHIRQEAAEFLEKEGEISATLLRKTGKVSLLGAITTKYPGKLNQLRKDLELEFLHKPDGYWTFETVKEETILFYQQYRDISQKLLYRNGRGDLVNQIRFHYPGGLYQVQVDLGVKPKQRLSKPNGYWTVEVILQEALDFYTQYGSISQQLLRQHRRADLKGAIEQHYPGKMTTLKEKLGITYSNPEDSISPDQANAELMRFLEVRDE